MTYHDARHLFFVRLCLLSILGLFVSCASAQYGGSGGMGGGRKGGGNGSQQSPRKDPQSECNLSQTNADAVPFDLVESRLMILEADLKLTEPQYPVWQIFQKKVEAYAGEVAKQYAPGASLLATNYQEMNGLKYLSQTVDRVRNLYVLLEDIEASAKQLYKRLATEQKSLLDMRMAAIVRPRFVNPKCQQPGY